MRSSINRIGVAVVATAVVAGFCSAPALGSVMYGTVGGSYTQNFDTLPYTPTNTNLQPAMMWQDDTTPTSSIISIPGWYLYHPILQTEGGTNGHQRIRLSSGNSTTGSFYSFGTNSTTDRALGDTTSNTLADVDNAVYLGLRLTNNTGQTLYKFTLSYTGEQWRNGGNTLTDTMAFSYSLDAAATIESGTYAAASSLDFTSPIATATAGALNGNDTANRTTIAATVSGIVWAAGTDLWLRWGDLNIAGTDHGLAIDDLTFTADVPEPATLGLLLLGGLALRRRAR